MMLVYKIMTGVKRVNREQISQITITLLEGKLHSHSRLNWPNNKALAILSSSNQVENQIKWRVFCWSRAMRQFSMEVDKQLLSLCVAEAEAMARLMGRIQWLLYLTSWLLWVLPRLLWQAVKCSGSLQCEPLVKQTWCKVQHQINTRRSFSLEEMQKDTVGHFPSTCNGGSLHRSGERGWRNYWRMCPADFWQLRSCEKGWVHIGSVLPCAPLLSPFGDRPGNC